MIFGEVHSEFRPSMKHPNKNFITSVRIFLVEGLGFYAQVIVSTCKRSGGYMQVIDEYYPVKIDIQMKEFIVIEKGEGTRRQFRFKDQLRCENIDQMIDLVIQAVSQEPDVTFEPHMISPEEVDNADWWKKGDDDPDWWRKGTEPTPLPEMTPEEHEKAGLTMMGAINDLIDKVQTGEIQPPKEEKEPLEKPTSNKGLDDIKPEDIPDTLPDDL
jgi:hypothetical protein